MNKELNSNMEMFYDRCSKKNSELLHSLRKSFTFFCKFFFALRKLIVRPITFRLRPPGNYVVKRNSNTFSDIIGRYIVDIMEQ